MSNSISGLSQIAPPLATAAETRALDPVQVEGAAQAEGTAAAAEAPAPRPAWLTSTVGTGTNYDMLGLAAPRSNGDLTALLAQASLSLEQTVDEGRKSSAIARLAGLAGQMTQFDLSNAAALVERTTATRTRAEATRTSLRDTSDTLLAQRGAATSDAGRASIDLRLFDARIASVDRQISDLKADLAAAPSQSAKDAIQQRIDAATGRRGDLVAEKAGRSGAVTAASNAVSSLQSQLDAERAKPAMARDPAQIASLEISLASAHSALRAVYGGLATAAASGIQSELSGLGTASTTARANETAARAALNLASSIAVAFARAAAASYQAAASNEANGAAERDRGIETAFGELDATLKEVASRTAAIDEARAGAQAAGEKAQDERLAALASALVGALANVVSVLAEAGGLAAAETSSAAATGPRPRTRIEA